MRSSRNIAHLDTQQPKYTVKAVSKITNLNAATLRAWEKRYGIPTPARTRSRYRLYSDADVREIQWLQARVEEGIPPRQAARLAIERRAEGVAPDDQAVGLAALVSDLKAACLAYDEDGAQAVLRRAGTVVPPHEIFRTILLPAIAAIGGDWEAGLVTVAQEHFTSQIARRFAHRLMDLYQARPDTPPVICACAPGEQHELGLLAVAVELRRRACPVVYLGQATPVNAVLEAIERLHARVAVVAASSPCHLQPWITEREDVAQSLGRAGATIVWGGPGAPPAVDAGLPGLVEATIDGAVEAALSRAAGRSATLS
jgi:DNA-binding transcriptional MerR regulator